MLTPSDLIHLPYTRDLTEGGIAYALHALPYLWAGRSPYEYLRRLVGGAVVELAFRRHLAEQAIPFEVKGAAPFTEPDRYDVALGGHRCEIKSFLISRRDQVAELRRDPQIILRAPALVASDKHAAGGNSGRDLYVFAFLAGLVATSPGDWHKLLERDQPHYLIHVMPQAWRRPQPWTPLGTLVFKSEAQAGLTMEIGGQAEDRQRHSCLLELPPHTRLEVETGLASLAYLHVKSKPAGRLGIYNPARKETYLVAPPDWGNIWVYGLDVLLAGYISREEFSRRASFMQAGVRVFQYDQTHVKNLAVPVSELKPLAELFDRMRVSRSQTTA